MKYPVLKRVFLNLDLMDYQMMTDYFKEMAAQGWMLHELGQVTVRFKKSEPADLKFDIGIYPEEPFDSRDDSVNWDNFNDIQQSGWKFVCSRQKFHIFCANAGDAPSPIHTDRIEEEKLIRKTLLIPSGILLVCFCCLYFFLAYQVFTRDYDLLLTNREIVNLLIFSVILLLLLIFEGYYLYRLVKVSRCVKHGLIPPQSTIKSARFRSRFLVSISAVMYLLVVGTDLAEASNFENKVLFSFFLILPVLLFCGSWLGRWSGFTENVLIGILLITGIFLPNYIQNHSTSPFGQKSSLLVPQSFTDYFEACDERVDETYIRSVHPLVSKYIFEEKANDTKSVTEAPAEQWDTDKAYYYPHGVILLKENVVIVLEGNQDFSQPETISACKEKLNLHP